MADAEKLCVQELSRDAYLKRCSERSDAPVKQSHLKMATSAVPFWRHVGNRGGEEFSMDENQRLSKKQAKKNKMEQAKKHLCPSVARGETCMRTESCRYGHDLKAFLEEKEKDLPGQCPFGSNGGICPHGWTCRFASTHKGVVVDLQEGQPPDKLFSLDGVSGTEWWMNDGSIPDHTIDVGGSSLVTLSSLNHLDKELQTKLRKRCYDFTQSDTILESLGIKNSMVKKSYQSKKRNDTDNGPANSPHKMQKSALEGCHDVGHKKSRDGTRKIFDARGKTFLAPLTTVGNLPFRRLCKSLGADITCGEMAMATNLLQGQTSEWALLRRHPDEDCFGVQICGAFPDSMTRCAQIIEDNCDIDFVDINCGCPIDLIVNKGAGSACLKRPQYLEQIVKGVSSVLSKPVTVKMRRGYHEGQDVAHTLIPKLSEWGASAVTLHGRTREQRYSKPADWNYIKYCAREAAQTSPHIQVVGNGDVFSWQDHVDALQSEDVASDVVTTYVARGALVKPWIFTEIKEKRDWDISASERLDIVKRFVTNGLEHWGSDSRGVENCRRFLLEWLSFAHRYVPLGLLEVLPQKSNWRPASFVGRSDLETLLGSPDPRDWIMISEMFLGKTPKNFTFTPKHKAKAYASPTSGQENG
ncbi:hypothetical protein M9434_002672 [Picochlorum sp. BPE23]|nr:hypothetical protein M9434_002672 [Picochlorum sp. BPE23]